MSEYVSNTTLDVVAERLRRARRVVITTHQKPDGDALGSGLALARAIGSLGIDASIWLIGPLSDNLRGLIDQDAIHFVDEESLPPNDADVIVVVDTGAWVQVEPLHNWLRERTDRIIGLDHHRNGDADMSAQRIVDPECAATTQLIVRLLDAMQVPLDSAAMADPLLAGLATDTGWFRFDSADAGVFRVVARLLEAGADKSRLFQLIEENDRPERLAMTSLALRSLELVADGHAAMMLLRPEDFQETGAVVEELNGIVNLPMTVGEVRACALLTSSGPAQTKISLRSKPAIDTPDRKYPAVDVNELARLFGGGGHRHAAGARLDCSIDEAVTEVRQVMESFVRDSLKAD